MNKSKLSEVMKSAWNYVKNLTMSDAMKLAWKNIKAKSKMLTSITTIKYQKKDGSIRTAHATLCPSLIPISSSNHSIHARKANDTIQCYYDMDKQSFRSYIKSNLIAII